MARLPTCPDCGIEITDKTIAKKISGRWVCPECQILRQQIQEDRKELYKYVAKLFYIEHPTGMMMKQIKDFRNELDYTYKGMTLSLEYWNEILGNSMANAKGVGIIPYIYEDAKKFYIDKMKVAKSVKNMNEPLTSNIKIYIHKTNINDENTTLQNKLIDMDDL